jgi:hypothetical protein
MVKYVNEAYLIFLESIYKLALTHGIHEYFLNFNDQ